MNNIGPLSLRERQNQQKQIKDQPPQAFQLGLDEESADRQDKQLKVEPVIQRLLPTT